MKINGLNVDAQAIADGLYQIICDKGEEHIVAFGMIPKWIMDLTEKMVREKVIAEGAKQMGCTVEELTPYLDNVVVDEITRAIVKQVATCIYGSASAVGGMVV